MNRIVQVDNFQNMACCCENWLEFTQELEEWGVTGCAKIEFDDPDLYLNLTWLFLVWSAKINLMQKKLRKKL